MAKQKHKTADMSVSAEEIDKLLGNKKPEVGDQKTTKQEEKGKGNKKKKVKTTHLRSGKYTAVRAKVDRTKNYPLLKAVELVQKTSYSKFPGTVTADLVVKDEKINAEVVFPFSTGRIIKTAIVSDEVIANIEAGQIDFDVLISHPQFMPKLVKLAKVLGPKGLMPNPKNGTVTTDPEKKAKELAGGKTQIKTEKKAPLIHIVIGKTDQLPKELVANAEALIKAIGNLRIVKMVLSATMSPGVKVEVV